MSVCLSVCPSVATKVAVGLFKSKSSTDIPAHTHAAPRFPWTTRQMHARCPKRNQTQPNARSLPQTLFLSVGHSRCVLQNQASNHAPRTTTTTAAAATAAATTTFFQLLLKVFIVARVIFKRLNPGAAEDWAEDVLVVRRHLPAAVPTQRLALGGT